MEGAVEVCARPLLLGRASFCGNGKGRRVGEVCTRSLRIESEVSEPRTASTFGAD